MPSAELGISVASAARGLRIGAQLLNAAFLAAFERGCPEVLVYYLQCNHHMHGICTRLGAEIVREYGECTARVPLRPIHEESRLVGIFAGGREVRLARPPGG